jgi:hypothetical protein
MWPGEGIIGLARRVTAEGQLAGGLGLEQQQRHAGEHAPGQALAQRMQPELHRRVLPQEHVMLEEHGDRAIQRHVQGGHQLALEAVAQTGSDTLGDLRRKDMGRGRHRSAFLEVTRALRQAQTYRNSRLLNVTGAPVSGGSARARLDLEGVRRTRTAQRCVRGYRVRRSGIIPL